MKLHLSCQISIIPFKKIQMHSPISHTICHICVMPALTIHMYLHNVRLQWRSWEHARSPSQSGGIYLMEGEFQRKSSNLLKKFRTALLQPHFYLLCAKTAMRIGELMSSSWRTHGNARLVGTEATELLGVEGLCGAAGLSCSYNGLCYSYICGCCSGWTETRWCYVTSTSVVALHSATVAH